MACPICGERCTCSPREDANGSRVSVILDPDSYHSLEAHDNQDLPARVSVLVDPELPGAGEDHFAASLEAAPETEEDPLDLDDDSGQFLGSSASQDALVGGRRHEPAVLDEPLADLVAPPSNGGTNGSAGASGSPAATPAPAPKAQASNPNGSGWREEVANRLDAYRSRRRRRADKSLSLNFEQVESSLPAAGGPPSKLIRFPNPPIVGTAVLDPVMMAEPEVAAAMVTEPAAPASAEAVCAESATTGALSIEELAAIASLAPAEELAEPVVDWTSSATYEPDPAEAETEAAPSLAMTLESSEDRHENAGEYAPEPARFAEFAGAEREFVVELPLQAAPMSQRLLSTAVDGGLVALGTALFTVSFFLFAEATPTLRLLLPMLVAVPCFFWCAYQFLFLEYVGSTPGMFVARLELTTFDDGLVDVSTRRWRAVAIVVSCVSLGLGYLWSLVDEDSLTWHDRITRTLVAPERLL